MQQFELRRAEGPTQPHCIARKFEQRFCAILIGVCLEGHRRATGEGRGRPRQTALTCQRLLLPLLVRACPASDASLSKSTVF